MALAPGSLLDGYEVVGPLGSGGMGDVYRARDPILKRDVAIKVLPTSVSRDADRLRRFEQEAQAAAALNHPNILAVYRFGVFEGAPYLVSELLEGGTLREVEERGPLGVRKAIDIGVQIANGLAAAHEKGIVHRDLKPENVFVTTDGRVKILDFGLAKLTQTVPTTDGPTQAAGTEPGMVMGTVGYMAPEQVRGLPSDRRADIFAFGAVLYEMLSGRRAFQRSTSADTMAAILHEDPPSISQAAQNTPPGLQRVVQRCLEKNPEQRFQSAADLGFALEALSDSGSGSGSRSTSASASSAHVAVTVANTRGWRKKLSWSAGVVVFLGVAAAAYLLLKPKEKVPFEHFSIRQVIDSKHVRHPAISPDGNYLAAVMRDASGEENMILHHIPTNSERPIVQELHYKYESVGFSPDGNYIYFGVAGPTSPNHTGDEYRVPVLGGHPTRVLENVDSQLSFTNGGRRVCFVRKDIAAGTYKTMSADADGGDEQTLAEYKNPAPDLFVCGADGRFGIAYSYAGGLERLDFSTRSRREVISAKALPGYYFTEMQWAPGEDALYVLNVKPGHTAGQVGLLSLANGSLRQVTNDLNNYLWLSVTSDGRTVAAVSADRNIRFAEYSLSDSRLNERPVDALYWFSWLNDDRIVESDLTTGSRIIDLRNNETSAVSDLGQALYFHAARCGKDAIVASGHTVSTVTPAHVYELFLNGSKPIELTKGEFDFFPQCSADGKWLYYADNHDSSDPYVMRQPLAGGTAQRVIAASVWFDLSPDGKLIVAAIADQTAKGHLEVLSTETLRTVMSLPRAGDDGLIAFSEDSKSILYTTEAGSDGVIWRQPLAKASPTKVGTLPGRYVQWIRPSPDGKRIGLTLSAPTSEAIMLHDDR